MLIYLTNFGVIPFRVKPEISTSGDEKVHWKSGNHNFFYWTILWRTLLRIVWCITIKILTVESKVIYGLQFKK